MSPSDGLVREVHTRAGAVVAGGAVVASLEVAVVGGVHHVVGMMYEPGMGITLWARNDDAYDEFTPLIDPGEDLELSADLSSLV